MECTANSAEVDQALNTKVDRECITILDDMPTYFYSNREIPTNENLVKQEHILLPTGTSQP